MQLATLRGLNGDPGGALAALADSAAENLPVPITQARLLGFARATALSGDLTKALATLAALDTPASDELAAELLEGAKRWPAALAALQTYAARVIPTEGTFNQADARLVLRIAAAAAQAGSEAVLAGLREKEGLRFPSGELFEMFRLLTVAPIVGVSDLPRANMETKLARAVPAASRALAP